MGPNQSVVDRNAHGTMHEGVAASISGPNRRRVLRTEAPPPSAQRLLALRLPGVRAYRCRSGSLLGSSSAPQTSWCRLGGGGWSLVDGRPEPIPFVVGEVF